MKMIKIWRNLRTLTLLFLSVSPILKSQREKEDRKRDVIEIGNLEEII